MLKKIQAALDWGFQTIERNVDRVTGPLWNPFKHLGSLGFFFYWVVAGSGLYLYVFLDTSVASAWRSVEAITHEQFYFGGVLRSLHRYASDGMVAMGLTHFVREFAKGRYTGARWYSWFTGLPVIGFMFVSGVTGYWLVWDQLAQYVAIASFEWLDWLGIFSAPVADNFLTRGSLDDRFFTLLVFMHIAIPLFLLFMIWIHIIRIAQAETNPPRGLMVISLGTMIGLSLVYPAVSHAEADLGIVPDTLNLDWWYLALYPLFDRWGPGALWAIVVGFGLVVGSLPWVRRAPKVVPAVVDLANCNGCGRCFNDCPYSAVVMRPRTDGRRFATMAVITPDLCTACGICFGACPSATPFRSTEAPESGILLPGVTLVQLRRQVEAMVRHLAGPARVLVIGCEHGALVPSDPANGIATLALACAGMLPPPFIDFVLTNGLADGIVVAGCRSEDCYHRLGQHWTEARFDRSRPPELRQRIPRERIHIAWVGNDGQDLAAQVADFRTRLAALPAVGADGKEAVR